MLNLKVNCTLQDNPSGLLNSGYNVILQYEYKSIKFLQVLICNSPTLKCLFSDEWNARILIIQLDEKN